MSNPGNSNDNDENNPFVAFRQAIDAQASSFFNILSELPIQLSAIQDDLRKDGEAATENIQSALRRLGEAYERSTNPERKQIDDRRSTIASMRQKEKEEEEVSVYTHQTQQMQEENLRRWLLDDGGFKFTKHTEPPQRRAWPDRSFFAFSPYSPLRLEQQSWYNPLINPDTFSRRELIWRDAFEDLLRTTAGAPVDTPQTPYTLGSALAQNQMALKLLDHQNTRRQLLALRGLRQEQESEGNAASSSLPLYYRATPSRWLWGLCAAKLIDDDDFHTLAHLVDTTTVPSTLSADSAKFPPTRDPYVDAGPIAGLAQIAADAWIREYPTYYPSPPLRLATTTTSTTTVRVGLNDGRQVTSTVTETHFPDGSVQRIGDVSQQVEGATAPAQVREEEWRSHLYHRHDQPNQHEDLRLHHRALQLDLKRRLAEVRHQAKEEKEERGRMWQAMGYRKRGHRMERIVEPGLWPEVDRRIYRGLKKEFAEEMRQEMGLGESDDEEEIAEVMPDLPWGTPNLGIGYEDKSASGNGKIGALKWTWSSKWGEENRAARETEKVMAMVRKEKVETPNNSTDKSSSGKIGGMSWAWSTKWDGNEKEKKKETPGMKDQDALNEKEAMKSKEWFWGSKWGEENEQAKRDAKATVEAKEEERAKAELREREEMTEKEKEKSASKSWSWYWSW